MTSVNSQAYLTVVKYLNIWLKNSTFGSIYLKGVLIVFERALVMTVGKFRVQFVLFDGGGIGYSANIDIV